MSENIPDHVGIIFDGNRRWAHLMHKDIAQGYEAGADNIHEFLTWCDQSAISFVTLYLLSLENFNRKIEELEVLATIITQLVADITKTKKYHVQHLGTLEILPEKLQHVIQRSVRDTSTISGMHVNIAIGYGGRQEIVDAVNAHLIQAAEKGISLEKCSENFTAQDITCNLYTHGQLEPDLIIRTSGEQRLSGFLLWQAAYSELYFCDVLWPDFTKNNFTQAINAYSLRKRRFGT